MPLINQKIMNYRLTTKIGEGGMGSVYLGVHELLQTKVAVKVLHAAFSADAELRKRFINEAKTLSAINHPNIVKVLDFYDGPEGLFIIMEYVAGIPLDELIKTKTGPIPEERAFAIFAKILDGFQYAHSLKPAIIHRDIKPSNIIIDENDEPKIIDFGIVKIVDADKTASGRTMAGTKIGTAFFMSPEQILAKEVDARSDIFSLGITLFIMLTGRSPFGSTLSEFEVHNTIVNEQLPRAKDVYPGVSDNAQNIIDKATEKRKEDRFQNCNAFKNALQNNIEVTKSLPPALPPKPLPPTLAAAKRNYTAAIVSIIAIAIIGLVVYVSTKSNDNKTVITYNPVNPNVIDSVLPTPIEPNTTVTPPALTDITEAEKQIITEKISNYFNECNKSTENMNFDYLLDFYEYPIQKYFSIYNATRTDLYKQFDNYLNKTIYGHHLEILWNQCSVYKNADDTYTFILRANYDLERRKAPGTLKHFDTNDTYILNSNFKFISVYSN